MRTEWKGGRRLVSGVWSAVFFVGGVSGVLRAQDRPVIDSIDRNGELRWADDAPAGQRYHVEWSYELEGPWHADWETLRDLLREDGGDSVKVGLPRFFRVVRDGASAWFPQAVTDEDFREPGSPEKVALGRDLFFDKILSGNRNISCATCHHPMAATGDGLSLPVGEGGFGLGVTRHGGMGETAALERVPRNAPPVFNLGAKEFTVLFHDGRVSVDPGHASGFRSPAGDDLPSGLDSVLAAQAMFPVTSGAEMAGQGEENEVSMASEAGDLPGVWAALAARLRDIPEYVDRFAMVFDDVSDASDITYVHAANAIAAFEEAAWRADDSPFDRFLRGDNTALNAAQRRGLGLFYGKAACAGCHSGKFQTDQGFHAVAFPQIGPGKGHGGSGHEDFGREPESGDEADRFRFRTPSLRNVALTGPWGHAGSHDTLEGAVRHMLDPVASLRSYSVAEAVLPDGDGFPVGDDLVMASPELVDAIAAANEAPTVELSEAEFADLMEFLNALTDVSSIDLRADVPRRVPSGLPVGD